MYYLDRMLMMMADGWFAVMPCRRPTRQALLDCRIIAHRGEHDNRAVPENSMAAFAAAAEAGCWGLEFDVRWTRDLYPVVIHDPDLRRVFDTDLEVAETDLADLQQRAPLVPTLEQVVQQFGGSHHLMIELKEDELGEVELRAERLQEVFAGLEPARDYHILALDPGLFELVGFCGPEACLPVAEYNIAELSRLALERHYGGVCSQYLLMRRHTINRHHDQQQMLGTGFASSRYSLYRELNRGVDWIFSNHAAQLAALRRKMLDD